MTSENQRDILKKIRATLTLDSKREYCFVCGAEGVAIEEAVVGEIFVCTTNGCRSPRAYIFDGLAVFSFENDVLYHQTAGAIIQRGSERTQQTLLFLRRKFPFLYTIPAGHVEIGNDPENEMRREVQEETGLVVKTAVPLFPEALLLQDPCRRGADFHGWFVYKVRAEGRVRMSEEARIIGWYADEEIQKLAAQNLLTSPVQAIFKQLNMLK